VNTEPHDLVGFQALLHPVVYFVTVNKETFTARPARTRPHAQSLTKAIINTATHKRRSILRLRTVQEHRNTIPRLKHLRLVSQRRKVSRFDKRILGHRKTIKVKADSVSGSKLRVKNLITKPFQISPRSNRISLPNSKLTLFLNIR